MTPDGTVTVLHEFAEGTVTDSPTTALIQATDGNFYGTTNGGTFYRLMAPSSFTPGGTVTVLCSLIGGPTDGRIPTPR